MNEIKNYTESIFDSIHIDEFDNEYWEAIELMRALEYVQWRRFEEVIDKAKIACINSSVDINGGKRKINDYKLSRYACYLII